MMMNSKKEPLLCGLALLSLLVCAIFYAICIHFNILGARDWGEAGGKELRSKFPSLQVGQVKEQVKIASRYDGRKNPSMDTTNYKWLTVELTMEATAYCACWKCTGKRPGDPGYGITKSGVMVKPGMVAVDPRVIDLGTHLWVEGYGDAVAADTGGMINGNRIDVFMVDKHGISGHERAMEFGRKTVRVKVVRKAGD